MQRDVDRLPGRSVDVLTVIDELVVAEQVHRIDEVPPLNGHVAMR
jgi:hypothetical protein